MRIIARCSIPLVGLISIVHFGCRTLSTSQETLPSGSAINGMLYYLPIGKITIKGEFKELAPSPTPCPTCSPKGSPAKAAGDDKGASAQATASPARGGDSTDASIGSTSQLTITLTSEVEADESKSAGVYYAKPHANYLYDDDVHVTVNSKQLLSTGNVTTQDKTVEIVGAVASLAAQFKAAAQGTPLPAKSRLPFYFSFHPSNADDVGRVREELDKRGITFTVEPTRAQVGKSVSISGVQARELGENGLLFRPAMSYKVTLIYKPENKENLQNLELIHTTQQFVLPDSDRLYKIEYPRMAFVTKVKNIGFTDGMLTDYQQKVPSPILGFLGIPKAIVQAIVPIPGAPPSGSGSASGTTNPH
jgi:hypothetical protein